MNKELKEHMSNVIVIVILAFLIIGVGALFNYNDTDYTITITDKERVTKKNGDSVSSKYLIFGDDESGNSLVFENTDTIFRMKFDSSNIQGQLKEGNRYKVTVVGYRVPIFSMYQNIIEVSQVK